MKELKNNSLEEVSVWNFVILGADKEGEIRKGKLDKNLVCGFVHSVFPDKVKLSHANNDSRTLSTSFTEGDSNYYLNRFSDYCVLGNIANNMVPRERGLLKGADLGDIVCLKTDKGNLVGGFLIGTTKSEIKISYEHPDNMPSFNKIWSRDRAYGIYKFTAYNVTKVESLMGQKAADTGSD